VSVKGVVFVDANQYLDLYRTVSGKKLLPALEEQRDFIFVTEQVVDEVYRNKVSAAACQLKNAKLELNSVAVPDDLLGVARACAQICCLWWSRRSAEMSKRQRKKFRKPAHDLLEQVSQSKDEVSKALAGVFSRAVAPTDGELQRARARKERGNPPGKRSDPLGDQLTWEQILSQCKDKLLWIITRDSDYGTKHEGEVFLNAVLYEDLARLYKSEPAVYCFDNIGQGLKHFADTTGAKAEKLPTPEETEQIKKEQESLPPLGWLTNYDDAAQIAIQGAYAMRDSMLWRAALSNQEEVIPPPAPKEGDKDGT
jgi:PIN domain-containing protein